MKLKLIVAVSVVAGLFLLQWATTRPTKELNTVTLLDFTNRVVGPVVGTYQKVTTNNAAFVASWLDAGTNVAILRFSNHQSFPIDIFPFARIHGSETVSHEAPVNNAPTMSGIRLASGESTDVEVAFLPQQKPWRIGVGYTRDPNYGSFFYKLSRDLPRLLRGQRNIVQHTIPVSTEWIQPERSLP